MVFTRKKKQQNRKPLGQLEEDDQDSIIGNYMNGTETKEKLQ